VQETIDALEMVRQMFAAGILQSAFWHQFTMTAHSPVGLEPAKYKVSKVTETEGTFANNDIVHLDPTGADHETFGFGLKKSLLNFMHGACLDYPLQKWFDFKVPKTSVPAGYIDEAIMNDEMTSDKPTAKIAWLGKDPSLEIVTKSKKGNQWELTSLTFETQQGQLNIKVDSQQGLWLAGMLKELSVYNTRAYTLGEVKQHYEAAGLQDFELFWDNKPVNTLYKAGLLKL
jgi:hypothetical protein